MKFVLFSNKKLQILNTKNLDLNTESFLWLQIWKEKKSTLNKEWDNEYPTKIL